MKLFLAFLLLLVPAAYSQYPGQYPPGQYPPGQYPPGQYPPGRQGPGMPIPRRGKSSQQQQAEQTHVIRGTVSAVEAKSVEIEAEDERIVTFQIVDTTKKPNGLVPGDKVEIDATQDDKGIFTASVIKKTGSGPAPAASKEPAAKDSSTEKGQPPSNPSEPPPDTTPATTMATPVPLDSDDEGGPPKLKRGIPKPRKPAASQTEVATNTAPSGTSRGTTEPAPGSPSTEPAPTAPADGEHMALIEKAREAAMEFLTGLPNYVCQQFTTRYLGEGKPIDWKAQDVVSADVVYENGKERYEHLAINGKPVKNKIEETGSWSRGEFGTVLADLFSPATAAEFKFVGNRTIRRQAAVLYDYEVAHSHSHWKIEVPGQAIFPAYRGSVWIAKDSGRVLRIEMQAVKIPVDFPHDTTEMALDYDFTNLDTQKYLLPVKAEVLSCQRGTSLCDRNVIEFRNYHKYAGESTITFH